MRLHSALLPLLLMVAILGAPIGSIGHQDSAIPEGTPSVQSSGTTVYIVRHAEKRAGKNPSLTSEGEERALDLAHMLGSSGVTHLLSSEYHRTQETLAPLAKSTGLKVQAYDGFQLKELVAKLHKLPRGSVVVVAGHSNTSPQLYTALGAGHAGDLDPKGNIPDDVFDRIYFTLLMNSPGGVQCVAAHELRYGK
jgi:phosphohistidine phosphatase SixA